MRQEKSERRCVGWGLRASDKQNYVETQRIRGGET